MYEYPYQPKSQGKHKFSVPKRPSPMFAKSNIRARYRVKGGRHRVLFYFYTYHGQRCEQFIMDVNNDILWLTTRGYCRIEEECCGTRGCDCNGILECTVERMW